MHFSRRVVFVFALIVSVPLIAMFFSISLFIYRQEISEIDSLCQRETEMNAEKIYENIDTCAHIERTVYAQSDLMLFLSDFKSRSEDEIISFMQEKTVFFERMLYVTTELYGLRLFSDNPSVPECFPIFLNEGRTDLAALSRWEFNYGVDFMGLSSQFTSPSVCQTKELKRGKLHLGWIQISIRMEDFFPFLFQSHTPWENNFVFKSDKMARSLEFIPAKNAKSLSALSEKDLAGFKKLFFSESSGKKQIIRIGKKRNLVAWREIPELGIVIAHTCSLDAVMKPLLLFLFLAPLCLIFVMVCFFMVISFASNRMFRGIYSVMEGMKQVRGGNLGVQLEVSGSGEVMETQQTFNAMTQQLSAQIEQIKREHELIADTEMKAMQNQINAHFLYNVLETIHMQALLADNDDVAQSILMLGKMMRYCLRWRIHTVELEQEIEYIQSYVYILNLRNDYEIALEFDIPENLRKIKIPKMILQPFVENSFIHGIEPLAKDTKIRVYTERGAGEKVWLCVRDYGAGMSGEKVKEILAYLEDEKYERDSTGSIGIKNIQQRLSLFYGPEFKLEIESQPGKGTTVRVPLLIKGEKNVKDSDS